MDLGPRILAPGRMLASHYVIDGHLGTGGFGITYSAVDGVFDRRIALKEFFPSAHAERAADGKVRCRPDADRDEFDALRALFRHEGQALAKFNHPNIVHVHQLFDENDTSYLAMELVDGVEFETWLRSLTQPPTQHQLDAIFVPLLAALDAMHVRGYLHRDISPQNFMVCGDELVPKLLDFGASRPIDSEIITAIIKRSYSAPEAYAVDNQKLQGRWTDIYSVAATIFRAIVGAPPPEGPARLLDETAPKLQATALGRGYRPNFLAAVDWGLELRPEHRPRSIGEWLTMLLPTQEPISRQARRNRTARKIFISYRRSDSEQIAGRIFDRLAARYGAGDVFFDTDAIPAAVDFREHVTAALRDSAAVVAIIGPRWQRRRGFFDRVLGKQPEDHVQTEVELAIANGVPLLPLLIGGATMPDGEQLPTSLRDLSRANATVVRAGRDFHKDIDQVIGLIDELRPALPTPSA